MDKQINKGRGPEVPPEVEALIGEIYLSKLKNDPSLTAKEVMVDVHCLLQKDGRQLRQGWPGISKVQKVITEINRERKKRPLGQEVPWSLGESTKPEYNIPPEATGDLLEVWQYCLAIDYVFTIREAQWVARLRNARNVFKDREESEGSGKRIGLLFDLARAYALRQQVCDVLKKPLDTRDLDAKLCMGDRVRIVFEALGLVPPLLVPYPQEAKENASEFYLNVAFTGSAATNIALCNIPKNALEKDNEAEKMKQLFTYTEGLPAVFDRIYASALTYLSKGPLWNTLSIDAYLQVLSYLREWVEWVPDLNPQKYKMMADRQGGLKPENILDPNVLKTVGYEITIENINEGESN